MNIEKRRYTKIVPRKKVHKFMSKPLLESRNIVLPEYRQEEDFKLYELSLKKRKDLDRIPVHISLFVRLTINQTSQLS